jgi:hypothetical protein
LTCYRVATVFYSVILSIDTITLIAISTFTTAMIINQSENQNYITKHKIKFLFFPLQKEISINLYPHTTNSINTKLLPSFHEFEHKTSMHFKVFKILYIKRNIPHFHTYNARK